RHPTSTLFPYTTLFRSNEAYVKGEFTFDELIACLLPLTLWYQEYLSRGEDEGRSPRQELADHREEVVEALLQPPGSERDTDAVRSEEHTSELQSRFDLV